MRVEFVERQNGPDRLASEAEIVFHEGPLAGMKLTGISIWRGAGDDLFVTFPSRSFGVGGERRFFDYLRCSEVGSVAVARVKTWIISEYRMAVGMAKPAEVALCPVCSEPMVEARDRFRDGTWAKQCFPCAQGGRS